MTTSGKIKIGLWPRKNSMAMIKLRYKQKMGGGKVHDNDKRCANGAA
jgi:hypothetical protein